jgi:sec-independent protein translocase protein TatC
MRRELDEQDDFKEMELWEHLDELRQRLIRAALYIALGLAVAWAIYPELWNLFFKPLKPVLEEHGWKIVFRNFTDGFMLRLKVSFVAGLVVAIPLVTLELWGFIAPGLTRQERKACQVVFPLSILFFFGGVVCGYMMMSVAIGYFAQFIPDTGELLQDPLEYIMFLVKMVVAFGVCFPLPVVLMFLAWVGLVSSETLKKGWRIAVVACFIVGAIATPGGDPMTMMVMAAPLAALYVTSIYLCALIEKFRQRQDLKELAQAS